MENTSYWKQYPIVVNADEIEHAITQDYFSSCSSQYELLCMTAPENKSCLLISMGSGGHGYVFAELAYLIFKHGFNVFIMPKQGPYKVSELIIRHEDAISHLQKVYGNNIHIFSEGLGGLVMLYVALKGVILKSLIFENSPAILTDPEFHRAMKKDGRAGRRRTFLLPFFRVLVKIFPKMPVPIRAYLAWHEVIDRDPQNYSKEKQLVQNYDHDPDFDKNYPLDAVMSLVNTPPPGPLPELKTPTLFIWANRGLIPSYFKQLFSRLKMPLKQLEEVDGGVFWMLSNPEKASEIIIKWIRVVENQY